MKRNKKGFTIVELVIVIAVIAILAAVLIPTFSSLIRRANESSDIVLTKNMNTILATSEGTGEEPETMFDVMKLMDKHGYKVENLNPRAGGNMIIWDQNNNRMIYVNEEMKVLYSENGATVEEGNRSGKRLTVKDVATMEKWQGFSYYLPVTIASETPITFSANSGIDTGVSELDADIVYNTQDAETIQLRGTIQSVELSAPNADVYNYAVIEKMTVKSVKASSYHECGEVKDFVIATGNSSANIVIENNATVGALSVSSGSAGTKLTIKGYVSELRSEALQGIAASFDGGKIAKVNGADAAETITGIEGTNNIDGFYNAISSYKELKEFGNRVNQGSTYEGITISLMADIEIPQDSGWTPIGFVSRDLFKSSTSSGAYRYFAGIFEGNGHTISNLNNNEFSTMNITDFRTDKYGDESKKNYVFGLFGVVHNAEIRNLTIENINVKNSAYSEAVVDSVGAIVGYVDGGVVIENCHAKSGSIEGEDGVGGIVGRIYNNINSSKTGEVIINGCSADLDLTVVDQKGAGIVGFISSAAQLDVTLANCTFTGKIEIKGQNGTYLGGIVVASGSVRSLTIMACKNEGTLTWAEVPVDENECVGKILGTQNALIPNLRYSETVAEDPETLAVIDGWKLQEELNEKCEWNRIENQG